MYEKVFIAINMTSVGLLACAASSASEPREWLPAAVERGVVQQLLERTATNQDAQPSNEAQRVAAAISAVRRLADALEQGGEVWIEGLAPDLSALGVVSASEPRLDTMLALQACWSYQYLRYEMANSQSVESMRVDAGRKSAGLLMAQIFLRQPYVQNGGDASSIEQALSGPLLEPLLHSLQGDANTRARVEQACAPVTKALVAPLLPVTPAG